MWNYFGNTHKPRPAETLSLRHASAGVLCVHVHVLYPPHWVSPLVATNTTCTIGAKRAFSKSVNPRALHDDNGCSHKSLEPHHVHTGT